MTTRMPEPKPEWPSDLSERERDMLTTLLQVRAFLKSTPSTDHRLKPLLEQVRQSIKRTGFRIR